MIAKWKWSHTSKTSTGVEPSRCDESQMAKDDMEVLCDNRGQSGRGELVELEVS
jgi:hypothetical protein